MKYSIALLGPISLALLMISGAATAQSTHNDVRCLMVSNIFAKAAKEQKVKQLGQAASFFYLGRIDDRMTQDQLKRAMLQQQKALQGANAGAIMKGCAALMQARARLIQTVGGQLTAKK